MSSGVGGNTATCQFASFDATGGFISYGEEGRQAVNHHQADEHALIEAARQELAVLNKQKSTRKPLARSHISQLADQVLFSEEGQPTYGQKLGQLLRQTHTQLPSVTIEYRGLSVEADALVGTGGNPSVANAFLGVAKAVTLQGGLRTRRVQLLKDVNGVLEPGRLTLVLGPPGSGKTLLLKALSGRLPASRHLRVEGSVRYNGASAEEFVIRRTAGLVEQQDHHMPTLTVLETLNFAAKCQNPHRGVSKYLEELDRAAATLKGRKRQRALQHDGDAGLEAAELGKGGEAIPPTQIELRQQNGGGSRKDGLGGGDVDLDVEAGVAGEGVGGVLQPEEFDEEFYRAFREIASHRLSPHLIMGIMGLSHCADTMVGNESLRGISGGERKRLTTAEILVGPQSVLLMDEISTGLDSATAYSVVRSFRDVAHSLQKTIAVSLLQPAPEVIDLFDDLLLLTEGQVIYHGPVDAVLPFFTSLGYECPVRKDPGSFLQEVTTPLGQLTYATPALLGARGVPEERRRPEELLTCPPKTLLTTVEEIKDAFWSNGRLGAAMLDRLEQRPFRKEDGSPFALFKARFANSSTYLSGLLFQRLGLLSLRMRGFYMARVVQTTIMGLIIGSLFVNIQPTPEDGRTVLAVCTLSIIFVAFSNMPQLSLVFATKRIFYKHRDAHLFPSWSYVCGMALVQIPQSTAEAAMYSLTVYFLTNFNRTAGGFFTFFLVAWSCSNCLAGLFRLLAYAGKTMVAANSAGGFTLLLMMMTNGFTIVRSSIPPYMIWIYWINPIAWSIRAVAVNELTSPRWSQPLPPSLGGGTLGEAVMAPFGFYSDRYWIWTAVAFLWGSLLLYSVLGAIALKYTDPPQPRAIVGEEEQREEVTRGLLAALRRRRRQLGRRFTFRRSMPSSASAKDVSKSTSAPSATAADPLGGCNGGKALAGVNGVHSVRGTSLKAGKGEGPAERPPHVVVPFTPITLVCRDIRYYVDDPSKGEAAGVVKGHDDKEIAGKLELLKGINVYAEPGQLTALMGGSGAGKTTLMDVVCGRKTVGIVRGDIFVNGHPKQQEPWSRVVGYVEQNDIHSAGTTVREALMFSARLRLDEKTISLEQVAAIVDETLEMVELWRLADSVVGEAGGDSGLSMEQRKRLSIAVELVANPAVVFMDEPTSGLDARAAAIVMRAVENVARSHRTVMVTIHQPSTEIFEAFDNLVLLQLGGRLTYFGPLGVDSSSLIAYLEQCPGVDPIRPGFNPATWMLEVTGGSMATVFRHAGGDFPDIYQASTLRADNEVRMDQLMEQGRAQHEPLTLSSRYATCISTQRKWLVKRFFAIYWRCPEYNFTRIAMAVVVGLLYGITFLNEGRLDAEGVDIAAVQNIMGLIFSMVIFLGMFNAMTVQPMVAAERVVYYRETAASMYAPAPYGFATGVAELPYIAAQSIIMVCITYWMVGLQAVAWKFFYFLLVFTMSLMMYTFFGQFLVFLTPNILIATILVAAFNQLWTIFNGFLIPYSQIPRGWQWMNRISPTTWILYGLGGSQLADSTVPLVGIAGERTTVGEFMGSYFDYKASFVWWCVLILGAYLVAFRVAAVLLLRHISYQRR